MSISLVAAKDWWREAGREGSHGRGGGRLRRSR